jgi:hypothetical protein
MDRVRRRRQRRGPFKLRIKEVPSPAVLLYECVQFFNSLPAGQAGPLAARVDVVLQRHVRIARHEAGIPEDAGVHLDFASPDWYEDYLNAISRASNPASDAASPITL